MAKEIEWNERFNIGVEEVDKAHRRLFSVVRKLMELSEDEKRGRWVCELKVSWVYIVKPINSL